MDKHPAKKFAWVGKRTGIALPSQICSEALWKNTIIQSLDCQMHESRVTILGKSSLDPGVESCVCSDAVFNDQVCGRLLVWWGRSCSKLPKTSGGEITRKMSTIPVAKVPWNTALSSSAHMCTGPGLMKTPWSLSPSRAASRCHGSQESWWCRCNTSTWKWPRSGVTTWTMEQSVA